MNVCRVKIVTPGEPDRLIDVKPAFLQEETIWTDTQPGKERLAEVNKFINQHSKGKVPEPVAIGEIHDRGLSELGERQMIALPKGSYTVPSVELDEVLPRPFVSEAVEDAPKVNPQEQMVEMMGKMTEMMVANTKALAALIDKVDKKK